MFASTSYTVCRIHIRYLVYLMFALRLLLRAHSREVLLFTGVPHYCVANSEIVIDYCCSAPMSSTTPRWRRLSQNYKPRTYQIDSNCLNQRRERTRYFCVTCHNFQKSTQWWFGEMFHIRTYESHNQLFYDVLSNGGEHKADISKFSFNTVCTSACFVQVKLPDHNTRTVRRELYSSQLIDEV